MAETLTRKNRELNDAFRRTFIGGAVVVTPGFEALDAELKSDILWRIRNCDAFDDDNDPEREHAEIYLDYRGVSVWVYIQYMDPSMTSMSSDSTDPAQTTRVMTIGLSGERMPGT